MLWMKENSRAGKGDAKQLKGVGEKVASCIQLFGLHQL